MPSRDLRESRDDPLEDVLGYAERAVDTNSFSRPADHNHSWLSAEQAPHGFLADFQTIRDLDNGQTLLVRLKYVVHVNTSALRKELAALGISRIRRAEGAVKTASRRRRAERSEES